MTSGGNISFDGWGNILESANSFVVVSLCVRLYIYDSGANIWLSSIMAKRWDICADTIHLYRLVLGSVNLAKSQGNL